MPLKDNTTNIIVALITAIASVIVTLITTGAFSSEEKKDSDELSDKKEVSVKNKKLSFPYIKTKNGDTINLRELHNQGLRIISTDTKMDWSARVDNVDIERKDIDRISPGIQDDVIKFVRLTEDAKYFIKKFASQRKLIDITALSHKNCDVAFFTKEELSPEDRTSGLDNYWYLVINIEDHHINLEQEIKIRAVRWNAFQAKNKNYWGRLVIGNEENSTISILLPHDKKINTNPYLTMQLSGQTTEEKTYSTLASDTTINDNSFVWNIDDPNPNHIYRAYIDWE